MFGLSVANRYIAGSDFTRQSTLERFPNGPIRVCDLALNPGRYVFP